MSVPSDFKLELVQVLFRHGARTCSISEAAIAMPEYIDQSFHQINGYDQLTNIGKAQAHNLGQVLRQRYDDFLGTKYRAEDVYAYSSDYDRTKMSLSLLLAGLYPPMLNEQQIWNPNLNWQPVPLHALPSELDILLQGFKRPRYKQLVKEMLASDLCKEKEAKLASLSQFLQEKRVHALKNYGFIGCMGVYNVLSSHKVSNAIIPDWYTDELMEVLKRHVHEYLNIKHSTTEMKKIAIGPLLKQFIENMDINDELKNPRKIYLYSGHDFNVFPFLKAHGIEDFKSIEYSCAMVLEKFRDPDGKIYVRLLMSNGADRPLTTLKLVNQEELCPIEDYLNVVKDVVPTDEEIDAILNDSHFGIDFKKVYTTDFPFRPDYQT